MFGVLPAMDDSDIYIPQKKAQAVRSKDTWDLGEKQHATFRVYLCNWASTLASAQCECTSKEACSPLHTRREY